jgi:hypothetical protein
MGQGIAMRRIVYTLVALVFAVCATAEPGRALRTVDLRDAQALQQLRESNPAHFEKVRRILDELSTHPERAESDWLRTTFDARDVELSRLLMKTSDPPKQLLQFTLDETRYMLHVTRSDLVAEPMPAR